jgi:hypothetical protein
MKRTEILNALAENFNLKTYLEIGTQNRDANFNKIKCKDKRCVDPDPIAKADFIGTSDDFFQRTSSVFDLIFIDGLHHAEQVKRDFENALECLTERGFIVIHDTCPTEEKYTKVPRDTKMWYGDVYKLLVMLKYYPGIEYCNIETDYGCCIVWKKEWWQEQHVVSDYLMNQITWKIYQEEKPLIPAMKLQITPQKIVTMIKEARMLSSKV